MTEPTPAPEPCSAAYCQTAEKRIRELEAALHKSMSLPPANVIDVHDADMKLRPPLERIELCAIVTRFVMPPCREASS